MNMDLTTVYNKYINDRNSLTLEEKKFLLDNAKHLYYTSSAELISDFEYDALEKEVGLENKNYVGTKHSDAYTVKHPYVMGSLSKVQIHQDKEGNIDWPTYLNAVHDYIYKYNKDCPAIVTPKYDGCSFEIHVTKMDNELKVEYSGRGDGNYGKDLKNQLEHFFDNDFFNNIIDYTYDNTEEYVLRGEVLVPKSIFNQKYSDKFANPRAFVAGMLNRIDKDLPEYNDLMVIIYDYKVKTNSEWKDLDWNDLRGSNPEYESYFPSYYNYFDICTNINTSEDFKKLYDKYEEYRDIADVALDGFVIKPISHFRQNNLTENRPSDCVAIKFTPMTEPTTVVDIEWNLGKTGEYIPTIVTEPVMMDGKNITRASAFNYGYLISKKISVGTKVVISLAGDIIPFIYKIEDTSKFDANKLGLNYPKNDSIIDGIHLKAIEVDRSFELMNSALQFRIPGFGSSNVMEFIKWKQEDCSGDEFFGIDPEPIPNNILLCTPNEIEYAIGGKTGTNIAKAYTKILSSIKLKDIILSCNFKLCGDKVAQQIENKLIGLPYDFTSMPKVAYEWIDDYNSNNWKLLKEIFKFNGWDIDTFKISEKEIESVKKEQSKIPVILTGEPNNYASKAEFMNCHPEYRLTGSWKEVQIVFTNSIKSNTGKMKKAREKNIEIRIY